MCAVPFFLYETCSAFTVSAALDLIPLFQTYIGLYFLTISGVDKSALILIVVASGAMIGVLCSDLTIRNCTKKRFTCWRADSTVFMIACYGIYAFRNDYSHVAMCGLLCAGFSFYFTFFFVRVTRQISKFLDVPFFSVKHKKN